MTKARFTRTSNQPPKVFDGPEIALHEVGRKTRCEQIQWPHLFPTATGESARQHAGAGWTLAALAFAQEQPSPAGERDASFAAHWQPHIAARAGALPTYLANSARRRVSLAFGDEAGPEGRAGRAR